MARLSVNLNKIALLRNSRRTGVPDLLAFARLALEAGADGLTVHPRPDERHIRGSDIAPLAEVLAPHRPGREFNIEGYPEPRLFGFVDSVRPEQVTLVPDPPGAFTSDSGWRLDEAERAVVLPAVARLRALGARAILFVDPDPEAPARVAATGAAGIEIYTGAYAAARGAGRAALLSACAETARRAAALGLVVNAGHDLNLENIPPLVAALPMLAEASIGHELTADALRLGWQDAIRQYRAALRG